MSFDTTCVHCGAAMAHAAAVCTACRQDETCVFTESDFAVLSAFANKPGVPDAFAAQMLREKLAAARIVPADRIDADMVTINSRVVFSVNDGPFESRTLVHWDREPDVGLTLPVTVPMSIAMLGRKAGGTVRYAQADGSHWSLRIVSVPYQPAAGRRRRSQLSQPHALPDPTPAVT